MFNKKLIFLCIAVVFSTLFPLTPAFSQGSIPTPLGSTKVWQALKADLNGSGKWNQISFADGTNQTTAATTGTFTGVYSATVLTGGGSGALDAIDGAGLSDLDAAIVQTDGIAYLYSLDATSAAAESSPDIISPDTNAGDKRWILQSIQAKRLLLPQVNDAANPSLAFGDGNTGFYEESDNQLIVSMAGTARYRFTTSDFFSESSSGFLLRRDAGSATEPIHSFRGDIDTGLGRAAEDQLSLIAGGVEGVRVTEAAGVITIKSEGALVIDSNAANTVSILNLENTAGDIDIFRTDNDPSGSLTGSIGDLAIDSINGVFYLKKSGSASSTGWVVIGGTSIFKSYSLSNPGNAGTFYIGGHYAFAAADTTLTIGGTVIQTFGSAGEAHGSHAFCVAEGVGGTDLVLTVTGVSITDAGARNDSDTEIIVADADTASTDDYFETSKKWLGQITYTLTGSSGAFTFNYGFVKYEDFGNINFTVTDFEATGEARANETGLNIELLHHEPTAFVYHTSSFIPNQTALISLASDYGTNNDVTNGDGFAYKRSGLSTAIVGSNNEGVIIRVTTAVNNSINDASFHIGVNLK